MASWNVSQGKACGRFMSVGAQLYRPIIIIYMWKICSVGDGGPGTVTVIATTT
jgi:hypothetical protein